jgi:hypothetical protein
LTDEKRIVSSRRYGVERRMLERRISFCKIIMSPDGYMVP